MLVDYYTDTDGQVLKEFLSKNRVELSKLEKTAAAMDEGWPPYDTLTREAFADPVNKMFPIFSKTAAQISALYVKAQSDEVPMEVKERVQEACDLFDLDEDVIGFQKVAKLMPKLAAEDFIFPEIRKLPVVDKETFELSQEVFTKIANELSFDDVVVGSRRLMQKAMQLGIDNLDPKIEKLAFVNEHINTGELSKIAHEKFLETGDNRYFEIMKVANEVPSEEAHFLLREMINVDREHNIDNTADLIQKVATHKKDDIIRLGHSEVPVEKVAGIPEDEWKEVLPYQEIAFFTENGFDKEAFEKLYYTMSPMEQEIIEAFIQKNM